MKAAITALATCCAVHLGLVGAVLAGPVPALAAAAGAVAAVALARRRRDPRADCC